MLSPPVLIDRDDSLARPFAPPPVALLVLYLLLGKTQDGANALAIKAEERKLSDLKASLAKTTAAMESKSSFDRKGEYFLPPAAPTVNIQILVWGGGRCQTFSFSFFPVEQTTSGIGHRVK